MSVFLQTGEIVVDDRRDDLATADGVEGDVVSAPRQPDVDLGPSGVIRTEVSGGAIGIPLGCVGGEAIAVQESALCTRANALFEVGAGNADLPSVFEINHEVVVAHGEHGPTGTVFDKALPVTPSGPKATVGDLGDDLVTGAIAGSRYRYLSTMQSPVSP
jgi:hypothetical protein